MSLTLTPAKVRHLPGQTLVSDGHGWLKPTGVYVPDAAKLDHGNVNVLIWVHGWFVTGAADLLSGDPAKVRDEVLNSHKNVVLVAPYLGHGEKSKDSTYSVKDLANSGWGKSYLDQVIDALGSAVGSDLKLGNLVIACHSGGGEGMRYLVDTLGPYAKNLRECWGFDCLYGANAHPDDANFWYGRAGATDSVPLYIFFGPSTTPQSVKLYLMSQGLAASDGTKRDPKGPVIGGLNIALGVPMPRTIDDLIDAAHISPPPPPKHAGKHERPITFADLAATNLSKQVHWPDDVHYQIARDDLLARLTAASFL